MNSITQQYQSSLRTSGKPSVFGRAVRHRFEATVRLPTAGIRAVTDWFTANPAARVGAVATLTGQVMEVVWQMKSAARSRG